MEGHGMTIKWLCYMGIAAAVLCGGCIASHTRTGVPFVKP